MLGDLSPEQVELADYMSELSEEAYSAAWMEGLEYALWEAAIGQRAQYGRLTFSQEKRTKLRELSDACGGWIVFGEPSEETWVPAAEWERLFNLWAADPTRRGSV